MAGYSNDTTVHIKTIDEFKKEKQDILKKHQAQIIDLKKEVASLIDEKERIKTDIVEKLKGLQKNIDVKSKEAKEVLRTINDLIVLAKQDLQAINNKVEKIDKELENRIRVFNKQLQVFNTEKKAFRITQRDIVADKKANNALTIDLTEREKSLEETIKVFEDGKKDDIVDLNKRKEILDITAKELDSTKAINVTKKKALDGQIAFFEKIKEEALALIKSSNIAIDEKTAFDKLKKEQEIETKRLKGWHIKIQQEDNSNKVTNRALANKDADIRRRERILIEAEKKLTNQ